MLANRVNTIKKHYDILSPYYEKLWGQHIHHGYYLTGKETKEEATRALIKLLVSKANIEPNSKVLDVGCGIGGTSIWLAKNLNCKVTGITISPIQIRMSNQNAKNIINKPLFLLSDTNNLQIKEKFDYVIAIEVLSHLNKKSEFFTKASKILNSKGKIIIADWFKKENLSQNSEIKYINPINKKMFVDLQYSKDYKNMLVKNNMAITYQEDISQNVKKTWYICLEIIKSKTLWLLAAKRGKEFIGFLEAFNSMKKGFESGVLRYEVIIVKKK